MSGIVLTTKMDVSQFTERMELSAREVINGLRRSVDRAARAARKDAIKVMARDIGVPASKFRDAVPLVKASTQGNISASWTVKKKAIGILNTGTFTSGLSWNRGSLSASTFRLTGGGSSALKSSRAFIMEANGGRVLMVRTGPGKKDFKPVYAETPATGMAQGDGAPRQDWEKIANRELAVNVGAEVQRALNGQVGPSPGAGGGE